MKYLTITSRSLTIVRWDAPLRYAPLMCGVSAKKMHDKLLGKIERAVDAWIGEIPFMHPCSGTKSLRFHIQADETGPSKKQKSMVSELAARYESLWPQIAVKLTEMRSTVPCESGPSSCPMPRVLLSIPGIVGTEYFDVMLGYEFEDDINEGEGYFVCFIGWEIKSAINAN